MTKREPLHRADVHDPIPEYDAHPQSLTGRIREHKLTDPVELGRAKQIQLDYRQRAGEADAQPRNG